MPEQERDAKLYFDFVSPYSYLALVQIEPFSRDHSLRWTLRPVVYGAILDATGLVGPVETSAKRRYTLRDILRSARLLGVPLVGPPAHPFLSLAPLRTVCAYADSPSVIGLAVALASAAWGEGKDLTDRAVLSSVVEGVGLEADHLGERIRADEVKLRLRRFTDEALAAGVFGVPTFEHAGELFWGHDRLDHLAARIDGRLPSVEAEAGSLERRPRGIDRKSRSDSPLP